MDRQITIFSFKVSFGIIGQVGKDLPCLWGQQNHSSRRLWGQQNHSSRRLMWDTKAQGTLLQQMLAITVHKNNAGGYAFTDAELFRQNTICVLIDQLYESLSDGMAGLRERTRTP